MSANNANARANQALKDYKTAQTNYEQNVREATDKFANEAKGITGQAGYNKALGMASQGANMLAGQASNQAQNAYRSAGLSKAQSAQLAGGQANQAYQQGFQGQQNQASNQLAQQLGASGQVAGQRLNAQGQLLSGAGQLAGMTQQEAQNRYNRGWGSAGNWLGAGGQLLGMFGFSDERLKDKVKLETPKTARDCCNRVNELLENKPQSKYKDLLITRGL